MKGRTSSMHAGRLMPLLLLMTGVACAQQRPLTGQMMGGNPPATTQPAPRAPVASPGAPLPSAADDQPAVTPAVAGADATAAMAGDSAGPVDMSGSRVGDVTRSLLQMQVDSHRPGRHLPMLGDEATLAYRRYRRSFNHDIPEFYEATVGKHGNERK